MLFMGMAPSVIRPKACCYDDVRRALERYHAASNACFQRKTLWRRLRMRAAYEHCWFVWQIYVIGCNLPPVDERALIENFRSLSARGRETVLKEALRIRNIAN